MSRNDRPGRPPPRSAWRRPPVEERADQVRTWEAVAVAGLRHAGLRDLATAWEQAAVAEASRPPSRAAFQPTDVVAALSRMTLLERVAETASGRLTWRYRLVGTEIVALIQADVTGETIERYHAPLAAMLRRQFDAAAETGEPAAYVVRTVVDHRPYAYEKIVLPVRSAPGAAVDQVVVASHPTDG